MAITKQLVRSVRQRLAERPEISLFRLAGELDASEAEVVTALPVHMRMKADAGRLEELWEALTRWEDVEVALTRPNGSRAVVPAASLPPGPFPGALARLYLANGLPPFFREEKGSAWFLSRANCRGERFSVCFFNARGDHLLSVHLYRERPCASAPERRAAYESLRLNFGVVPKPGLPCGAKGAYTGSVHARDGRKNAAAARVA